jgi:hypothetical protein
MKSYSALAVYVGVLALLWLVGLLAGLSAGLLLSLSALVAGVAMLYFGQRNRNRLLLFVGAAFTAAVLFDLFWVRNS